MVEMILNPSKVFQDLLQTYSDQNRGTTTMTPRHSNGHEDVGVIDTETKTINVHGHQTCLCYNSDLHHHVNDRKISLMLKISDII